MHQVFCLFIGHFLTHAVSYLARCLAIEHGAELDLLGI